MDDALDTWACLYAEESSWDDVERALIELKGEHYWEGGHLDRLRSMEHASLYLWHILEDAEWIYGHMGEEEMKCAIDNICDALMELAMNG